ncbi:MAG TPA: hypothetical protein DCR24_02610 [Bacillus bacterium]|nr:hypothetical protein [Bacillus sp. (in: firmicutes)]
MRTKWTYILFILAFIYILKEGQALAITIDNTKSGGTMNKEELIFPADIRFVEGGESYIPIWRFAKASDTGVLSDPKARTVRIMKKDSWIEFKGESDEVYTAEGGKLTGRVIYKNENIYVPVEVAGDYFGYNIRFTAEENRANARFQDEYEYDGFPTPVRKEKSPAENAQQVSALKKTESNFEASGKDSALITAASRPGKNPIKHVNGKKTVYLTFDDGPTENTPEILDILKLKQAKATFFMIEPQMKQYSDQVKRLVKEGHYPALHSVTHDKGKLYGGNPNNLSAEMEQTRKTLLEITGVNSYLTRVPYGSKPFMKDEFRNGLVAGGFKMWDWNIDTMDWKYQRSNPQRILKAVIEGVKANEGTDEPLVVLMHVNSGTASVLPEIIDFLQKQGYSCEAYDPEFHFQMNFWKDNRL